ncbi:hypothetical protein B0H14DRAFT_3164485 [Mycena olivaceomarginata]|nr:hypothetical protein B0H14DRAFT_3164485 [Mycena olivaceomarginata]
MFLPSHVSFSPPSVRTSPPCSPPSWLKAGVWVERESERDSRRAFTWRPCCSPRSWLKVGVWVESGSERDGCRVYLATMWPAGVWHPPVPTTHGGCGQAGLWQALLCCLPPKVVGGRSLGAGVSSSAVCRTRIWRPWASGLKRESERDGCRVYLATCAHHAWRMWQAGLWQALLCCLPPKVVGGRSLSAGVSSSAACRACIWQLALSSPKFESNEMRGWANLRQNQFIERTEGPEPLYTFLPGADNQPPFTLEEKPKCSWHQAQSPGEKTSDTVD